MVKIVHEALFIKKINKIKDKRSKELVKKCMKKIIERPEIGKPMKYSCKGTRELYLGHYRISYSYKEEIVTLYFLDYYHKDEQ